MPDLVDRITVASDMERQRVGAIFTSRKNRVFTVDIDGHRYVAKVFSQVTSALTDVGRPLPRRHISSLFP